MSLGGPWLILPLAWVLGVAGQLQQAAFWRSNVPAEVLCERDRGRRYWHHRPVEQGDADALEETVRDPD